MLLRWPPSLRFELITKRYVCEREEEKDDSEERTWKCWREKQKSSFSGEWIGKFQTFPGPRVLTGNNKTITADVPVSICISLQTDKFCVSSFDFKTWYSLCESLFFFCALTKCEGSFWNFRLDKRPGLIKSINFTTLHVGPAWRCAFMCLYTFLWAIYHFSLRRKAELVVSMLVIIIIITLFLIDTARIKETVKLDHS